MDGYRYEDKEGDWLTIAESDSAPGFALVKARGGANVDPMDIPEITAKLYEACGHVPPVMLGRPETNPNGTGTALGRVYPHHAANGPLVAVSSDDGRRFLNPHEARQAAAVLVAYADAAGPEPDPAEVEELAREIHASGPYAGMAPDPSGDERDAARAALLWMRKREAAS